MIVKKWMLIWTVLIASAAFSQNAEPTKLSLQDALALAKKNNYTLHNAKLDQKIAEKKVNEITAIGLPQVNATGTYLNNIEIPTQALPDFISPAVYGTLLRYGLVNPATNPPPPAGVIPAQFGQKNNMTASITASQLLFDGTYFLGLKAAKEYTHLTKIGVKRTEIEIAAGVTKIYYSALLAQVNVTMLDATLQTIEKGLNDTRAVYANGLIEKIDLDRLELSYSNTKIQRQKIADQYVIATLMLKLQLGLNVNDSVVLTDDLNKITSPQQSTLVSKTDYAQRTEYQMIERQLQLQNYDKKRYQYGYAPSLAAFITHQRNTFGTEIGDLGKTWYPGTFWGVNLNIPVFDGLRKSSQIQQAKLQVLKLENDRKNLEQVIDNEIQQNKLKYERSVEQVELQKKNMQLAQEIYDRASIKYKNGVGSSLELMTAENELKASQTNYLGAVYEMLVNQVDLKKSLGQFN